jgi:hypothetical protein
VLVGRSRRYAGFNHHDSTRRIFEPIAPKREWCVRRDVTFGVRIRRARDAWPVYGRGPTDSAIAMAEAATSMEATQPQTSAQIEAEIRRLKQQTMRVMSPEQQRYRALLCESVQLEIARLERQRAHALRLEDQRRGALLRKYLQGRHGRAIRALLRRVVGVRDRFLFEL